MEASLLSTAGAYVYVSIELAQLAAALALLFYNVIYQFFSLSYSSNVIDYDVIIWKWILSVTDRIVIVLPNL